MAFIPLADGVKVVLRYEDNGQQIINRFYVTVAEAITEALLTDIAAIFANWWVTAGSTNATSGVSLQAVDAIDASVDGGLGVEYTTGLPHSGAVSGTQLPNMVTLAIKMLTGLTGRSHRGRMYWPGISETQMSDDNTVSTSSANGMVTNLNSLISELAASAFTLVVASFIHAGAPRTAGVATPVTTFAYVDRTVDTQRRRGPGRGT